FFDNYAGVVDDDLDDTTISGLHVSYCASQQSLSGTYYHDNIQFTGGLLPEFVDNTQTDFTLNDYHLTCDSPCLDAGDGTAFPDDTYDVDGDSNTSEDTPDLDLQPRIVTTIDLGPYELAEEC